MKARRDSLLLAVGFFAITATWVQISGKVAFLIAKSEEELQVIEQWKGLGFMAFMSVSIFYVSSWVFRRNAEATRQLIESQQKLVQAEREAVTGLLASSVAHDISNLMTIQRLALEKLKSTVGFPDGARDSLERLDRATESLTGIVTRLRNAGRSLFREPPRVFDAGVAVSDTVALMRIHAATRDCEIIYVEPSARVELQGYPVLVHQIAMNLILNAGEATNGRGRVHVQVAKTEGGIKMCVCDNGPGVRGVEKDEIFQAFFSTKASGSGLGLTSVRSSVEIHDGTITVGTSRDLGGARFDVTLPNLDERRVAEPASDKFLESFGKNLLGGTHFSL